MESGSREIVAPRQHRRETGATRWLAATLGLLCAGAALHTAYLLFHCPLDLSGDEALYWEWSRHLDLSYYSKGPLVAYVIALGRWALAAWSRHVLGNEALAVRLPAVLLSLLTGLGIFVLAVRVLRSGRLAFFAVALMFTVPILAAGSMLMTIDAPLACAWVWALVAARHALRRGALWAWVVVGLLTAVGILAKYTMVLIFPALVLAMLVETRFRTRRTVFGLALAILIGLLGLAPIVVWNVQHGWVGLRHVAGQAGLAGGPRVDLAGIIKYIGGQLGVVGLVWLPAMAWALVELWRRPEPGDDERHDSASLRLLLCATAVPFVAFLVFSPITKVQPNWPVLGLLPGLIVLVAWLGRCTRAVNSSGKRLVRRLVVAGVLLSFPAVVVGHHTEWLAPVFGWLARGSPPLRLTRPAAPWELTPAARYDPTARLRGWSKLGQAVGEVLTNERAAGRDPFILADDYQVASLIAFYCPGQPATYSAQSALGGRLSQYDIWPNPVRDRDLFADRPCIYVGPLTAAITGEGGGHAALPGVRRVRTVEYAVGGCPMQIWSISVCDRFAGFERPAAGDTRY
jgi:4-amino-4-deoxy-L-arabinose transferase-like glycosyltransferase